MKKSLFLFFFALLFFTHQIEAQDETRASASWQVTKYDITASLPQNPTDRNLTAKATITLKNIGRGAGSTATFRINPKAEITGTKVGSSVSDFRKTIEDKLGGLQRFTVSLPGSIQPNESVIVSVDYRLSISDNSGLNAISPVGSQFLPLSVWYPTPNNPYSPRGADYAPFRLVINGVNGESVVSSGKVNGTAIEQNLFAQPFFVTGNWDVLEGASGISIYLPKGVSPEERKRAEEISALSGAARDFISGLLGTLNNVPIRIVAVSRGAGYTDGGTILVDPAVFRRQKIDSQTAILIAESIAKIWIGNSTPLYSEGQGALREGLSRYLATQFIQKQFGKDTADIERLRQRIAFTNVAKNEVPLAKTSPLDLSYYASTSNKGANLWRLVARSLGEDKLFSVLKAQLLANKESGLTLSDLRAKLSEQNENLQQILNLSLDQATDTDLLVGLPQIKGAETTVALRNIGSLPVNVNVFALSEKGETLSASVNIPAKDFGEAVFKTTAKIVRVEVDPEKLYPQIDYSNDIAPRQFNENDLQAEIARTFNRQEFSQAEAAARKVLQLFPHLDEVRTWLGRSLLEQNRLEEAEREFNSALNETLPTPRTLAWSNIGLGEIAMKRNQKTQAAAFFSLAVRADAEYASNLTARNQRIEAEGTTVSVDEAAKTFFAAFDKAVLAKQKAQVDALILPGELTRFSGGISANQPEIWQTQVRRSEFLDANRLAVDVVLNTKIINREQQSGTALFILAKSGNVWKLASVDLFEVK